MKGIRFGDLYFEEREVFQVVVEPSGVEDISWTKEEGISLRLITDELSINFHYTTGRENIESFALERGKYFQKEVLAEFLSLASSTSSRLNPDGPLAYARGDKKRARGDKVSDLVQSLTEVAKASLVSQHIKHYRLQVALIQKRIGILTTEKNLIFEERFYTRGIAFCVAEKDGRLERGYEVLAYALPFQEIKLEELERLCEKAGRRAELMLSSRRVKAGVMPVVLSSSAGGTLIHEAVGHGLEADHAEEGLSIYSGRLGERVASPLITVLDDPTLSPLYGSYQYDDEGTKAKPVVLIEKGILKEFLYDRYQALKWGKTSNGRGRRESFRHIPIPRMSNTFIAKGETPAEEIIKSLDKGLLVKKMGGGEVNPLTGDFVFEVREGYYVEGGEVLFPVKGATLVGNGPKVLEIIDLVGDDLHFDPGTCGKDGQGVPVSDGQPTLRIPELTVGGEG
ncbi:MAG: TldD/PmbA family protein [Caldimicrobium sp.]|jgi:TldD protein|nr:TldD/PmbA family protein [Caldimicrobium sp.]